MKTKKTYEGEARKLGLAIDIAIESFKQKCPQNFNKTHQDHIISTYQNWKESCLNPNPQFKTLTSLKYTINDVFSYFQEGAGPTVEYFWKRVKEQGLDYKRENKLAKILTRGTIKGRIEYDYVTDMIVVAEQVGLTTKSETMKLSAMLEAYERKK